MCIRLLRKKEEKMDTAKAVSSYSDAQVRSRKDVYKYRG